MSKTCKASIAARDRIEWCPWRRTRSSTCFYHAPLTVAAIQNMILTAERLGIGFCWLQLARFFFAALCLRKGRPIRHFYAPKA